MLYLSINSESEAPISYLQAESKSSGRPKLVPGEFGSHP